MFDANYNGGYTVKWAQQACGVAADGKMGPNTIAAIKDADARTLPSIPRLPPAIPQWPEDVADVQPRLVEPYC
jgi:hypothetical protein